MSQIVLFHSVLGVRPGVRDAAERLRAAGHKVLVVDQYEGRVFDDYDEASAHAESIGYPALMQRGAAAVEHLPDGFIVAGFSNGGGMAEYVATQRGVAGVLMLSGALPLDMLGASASPTGVPAQIHYTIGDPFRRPEWIDALATAIRGAGTSVEVFDYRTAICSPTASLPDEYDPQAAERLWRRVLDFCAGPPTA